MIAFQGKTTRRAKSKPFCHAIRLINASVSGGRQEMLNNQYPENASHKEREHVTFCYQKIRWTYEAGGLTAEDDWEAPVA